ncbi:MAG TPA: ATP synthase F1 subunit delta [Bacteroidales bacterium]|nr:ATP synthase F1 subunit delta [Bacteroidales bacterium]
MNQSKITVRYARALLSSAKEAGVLNDVYNDINSLLHVFNQSTDLKEVFANPIIKPSLKIKIMKEITASMHKLVQSLSILIIQNDREALYTDICRDFISFYKAEMGIKTASLFTVAPVGEKNLKSIRDMLAAHFDAEIEMNQITNEKLIGGFIARIDDIQIDASVKSGLEKLKRELSLDTYKSKI